MDTSPASALASMLTASLAASQLPVSIDAEAAATLLHCSKRQIELLAEGDQLPGTKFGHGWIFVTAQLIHCVIERCAKKMTAASEVTSPPHTTASVQPSNAKVRRSRARRRRCSAVPDV